MLHVLPQLAPLHRVTVLLRLVPAVFGRLAALSALLLLALQAISVLVGAVVLSRVKVVLVAVLSQLLSLTLTVPVTLLALHLVTKVLRTRLALLQLLVVLLHRVAFSLKRR